MWDEIMDMPGEIFDITDEDRDQMIAEWEEEDEENSQPGWGLMGWDE